jgi:hypothetical protein
MTSPSNPLTWYLVGSVYEFLGLRPRPDDGDVEGHLARLDKHWDLVKTTLKEWWSLFLWHEERMTLIRPKSPRAPSG